VQAFYFGINFASYFAIKIHHLADVLNMRLYFNPVNTAGYISERFSKGKGIESGEIACVDVRFQKGLIEV